MEKHLAMKRGMHARMCAHTRTHSTSAQGGISKLLLQSKKLDTEECSVVHLREIQELANLIYGDRDQNNHYLWKVAE